MVIGETTRKKVMKNRKNQTEGAGDTPLKSLPAAVSSRVQMRSARVQLNVDLGDTDLRDRFKKVCSFRGIHMTERLLQLMEQDIREWFEKTGGRVSFNVASVEPAGQVHFSY